MTTITLKKAPAGRNPTEASTKTTHAHSNTLSPDQAQALAELHEFAGSDRSRHALAGPAGSGKTHLVGRFLAETRCKVRLSATTNKAAHVAGRMAPGKQAATIHSLLGLRPEPDHRKGRMVLRAKREPQIQAGDLVVIDEASMVDSDLLATIDSYARKIGFRVLYVGDEYQLPPIFEATSPAFQEVTVSRLTTIHRQAAENPIIAAATGFRRVLDGEAFPVLRSAAKGLRLVQERQFESLLLSAFDSDRYRADEDFCRAIAWTNARVCELNTRIRRQLIGRDADRYPFTPGEVFVVNEAVAEPDELIFPTEARVEVVQAYPDHITDAGVRVDGHRVTCGTADQTAELFVADDRKAAAAVLSHYAKAAQALQKAHAEARKSRPDEADRIDAERRAAWRTFFMVKRQFADLRPPHASTVHKSQGSTYQHAFIDIGDIGRCTRADLIARLAYVALTRPAQSAHVVGDLPRRLYAEAAA